MRPRKRRQVDGFFWFESATHKYCVVVLDRERREWRTNKLGERVQRTVAREYRARTIRDLRQKMARGHWVMPRNAKALCLEKVH